MTGPGSQSRTPREDISAVDSHQATVKGVELMELPVLLALDKDPEALRALENQLVQRYVHDYRVECFRDPSKALSRLSELSCLGNRLRLCLRPSPSPSRQAAASSKASVSCTRTRSALCWFLPMSGQVARAQKQSAPQSRWDVCTITWSDQPGRPTRSSTRPSRAFSSSGQLKRTVPHTIHIVGKEWSGRAFELRDTFERCAVPHTFCLADSD